MCGGGPLHRDVKRAQALQAQGAEKFRQGHFAQARGRFEQAGRMFAAALGGDAAQTLEALSDAGAACAALGEHEGARAAHAAVLAARRRVLGADHQSVATSLHNLGLVCFAQGDFVGAEACHREALGIWQAALGPAHPVLGKALGALAAAARARGDAPAALAYAGQCLALRQATLAADDPQVALAFDEVAAAFVLAGDEASALAAWESALDVLRRRFGADTAQAGPVLTNLGVTCRGLGDLEAARGWFVEAVRVAPGLAMARHHLAACLGRLGEHTEAGLQRALALAQQSVFCERARGEERRRVLIVSVSDDGNVPLEHILPGRDFTRIWWFPAEGRTAVLPAFDVVFNGIGDPDMEGGAGAVLQGLCETCAKPVLNRAAMVARTRRDFLAQTLAGIEGVFVPATRRMTAAVADVEAPFLLRPVGSHGGVGLRRLHDFGGVDFSVAPAWYVTPFVDFRAADGFYRKYRMAFVDRRPYPYHLAISTDWLVHYFSADMAHGWKLAEEAAFLADPRKVLGGRGYDALVAVGQRLDLDFCGIDFSVLPDGRILVFEANATMLIHPEHETSVFAFKNRFVSIIIDAVADLVLKA